MVWAAIGSAAVSTVVGGAIQADSARSAANKQADAAKAAASQNEALQKPWLDAGSKALTRLDAGLQPGGEYTKRFTMDDATNSPAEQHALQQGTQAIQNSAAAKGGLINSNVMQDLTKFGQENAASYQNQAFNQWNVQQNRDLGAQQSLAQVGQTSASNVADANSNALLSSGGAQAGAQIAQGNAMSGAIGQIGNILGQSKLFDPKPTIDPYGGYPSGVTNPVGNDAVNVGAGYQSTDYSLGGARLSDERLKTDIEHVGETKGGLPIYTYRLRGQRAKQMGVMAQDVEDVIPRAVSKHPQHGFRMVDYGRVK